MTFIIKKSNYLSVNS